MKITVFTHMCAIPRLVAMRAMEPKMGSIRSDATLRRMLAWALIALLSWSRVSYAQPIDNAQTPAPVQSNKRTGFTAPAPLAETSASPARGVANRAIGGAGQSIYGSGSEHQITGLSMQDRQNIIIDTVGALKDKKKPENTKPLPFEVLVRQNLGIALKIYGQDLFAQGSSATQTLSQAEATGVPSDYVVGPGDELNIRVFGQINLDYKVLVDRNGVITIPQIGQLQIAGTTFDSLEQKIKKEFSRNYKNFEVSVSIGQLKGLQVFVTGFAQNPSSYVLGSLSTVVNALFASGGPAPNGSLRNIEVRRHGHTVAKIDMYRFLRYGDKSVDIRLKSGDVIYIPPAKNWVAVSGSVNAPAIFELLQNENVNDAIQFAGGLSSSAGASKITIEREKGSEGREVIEVNETAGKTNTQTLLDGDMLIVVPHSPKFVNAVTLRGSVAVPIRRQWKAGMRISDLIPDQEALISTKYWQERNLGIEVETLANGGTRAEVRLSFPEINWDFATVERLNMDKLTTKLIPFNLRQAMVDKEASQNLELEPGDVVNIFSLKDFKVPRGMVNRYVRIEGEVKRAGVYSVSADETLHDIIAKAGGLSKNAYLYGTDLRRVSVRELQARRMNESISRLEKDYQRYAMGRAQSVASTEEAAALGSETVALQTLVTKLREVKPMGRLVLEMNYQDKEIASLPALSLENDDVIVIPPKPDTVEVIGGVYNENSFLYKPEKSIDKYLEQAGGTIAQADTARIYVVRPDGSIKSKATSWFDRPEIFPGDTIVVPEEFERISFMKGLKDWTTVFYQFILGVGGLRILKGL